MTASKLQNFWKTFGPGIMFAGTCIGGSHLVKSTQAGAYYGFGLIIIVLLANLLKYPFFEFASRYTNATGDSVLEGYKKIGKWTIYLYGGVTIFSMFIISAAIIALTSGLANNMFSSLFNINISGKYWPIIMLVIVSLLLLSGKFGILDGALKIIGLVLVVTVTIAFFSVVGKPLPKESPSAWSIVTDMKGGGFAFTIFLMGWMPMGVDMSAWHSLWTQERIRQTGYHPTLKETLLDFNIGYIITVVLAVFFLCIGAYSIYGNDSITLNPKASGLEYSQTLVSMFTKTVGDWSKIIIMIAAFATMFGTSITLMDGYCRSVVRIFKLLRINESSSEKKKHFAFTIIVLSIGAYLIIYFIGKEMITILNWATATSFIIAPIAAWLNFRIMQNKEVQEVYKPNKVLIVLSYLGIAFLSIFTCLYLYFLITK